MAVRKLLGADYRVPYKLARAAQYWPERTPEARRRAITGKWRTIRRAIGERIAGVAMRVPSRGPLKKYEDALDAVVCAWAGIEYLDGRALAHGDDTAAVWA